MAFDVKKAVEEAVKKLEANPELLKKFDKEPVKALEGILGVDLPDDKVQPLIDGIKAKLDLNSLSGKLGGLGKLFQK